jgi:UDP-N-acetylmuramoylalanine--D-glutamate ligase
VDTPAARPGGLLVVEVSSFQLESVSTFRADVAVLLNIADDHLDRHGDREAYAAAKGRIFLNQGPRDVAVTGADRPECAARATSSAARQLRFSATRELEQGAFLSGDELCLRVDGDERRFPLAGMPLVGRPNHENMLAALLATNGFGLDAAEACKALAGFEPLPHRLQPVGAGRGLRFYDDSKGTNVAASVEALCAFDGRAVLIAGGLDKGGDLAPLRAAVERRARAVVLIGAARERFAEALRGAAPIFLADDMREAVAQAVAAAVPGDVVVLSPACASFDMYRDFGHRGDVFQAAVRESLGR